MIALSPDKSSSIINPRYLTSLTFLISTSPHFTLKDSTSLSFLFVKVAQAHFYSEHIWLINFPYI